MKITISDNNNIIKLIEYTEDSRMVCCKNQKVNIKDRKIIENLIIKNDLIQKKIKDKIICLDTCPHSNYLWFNAIVIHESFTGFILIFLNLIKDIYLRMNIQCVFFLDLWPIIIAILPGEEVEIFFNRDNTNITDVVKVVSLGLE